MYRRKLGKIKNPTTIVRRTYVLQVVLNPDEKALLEMGARREGISLSEFARRWISIGVQEAHKGALA